MLTTICPISKLTFISKLLERIVLNQLNVCLQQFNLLPGLQSAYMTLSFH